MRTFGWLRSLLYLSMLFSSALSAEIIKYEYTGIISAPSSGVDTLGLSGANMTYSVWVDDAADPIGFSITPMDNPPGLIITNTNWPSFKSELIIASGANAGTYTDGSSYLQIQNTNYQDVIVMRSTEGFGVSDNDIVIYANINILPKQYSIGEAPVQPVVTNQEPVHGTLSLEAVTPGGDRTAYEIVFPTDSANGVMVAFEEITIDLLPGDETNFVDISSADELSIDIAGSASFDAVQIDSQSVRFGPGQAAALSAPGSLLDANNDGFDDMRLEFAVSDTGLTCDFSGEVTISGELNGRLTMFEGTDMVTTEECDTSCHP